MTDYTELKSKLRNGIDFDDSKEAADAIESLDRQIAELSKDAEPACWMTPDGEGWRMRTEPPTVDVKLGWMPLFTHPANTKAAISAAYEQGKRNAVPEDIRKDAESWRAYKKRKDEVIAAGMGKKILRDAAAPKQEK